jgi:hypothetical protein
MEEEEEEEEEAMPHMESARRINVLIEEPLPLMVVVNSCLQVILPCTVFLAMHFLVVNNFLFHFSLYFEGPPPAEDP